MTDFDHAAIDEILASRVRLAIVAFLAGAKTADYAHTKDAGIPRCARNEQTLNAQLVPMFDPSGRLFLAYDSPVREDEVFTLEQTRTAGASGAITRTEVRASVGLDPVPWGEQPLVPNNMVEVDPQTGKLVSRTYLEIQS